RILRDPPQPLLRGLLRRPLLDVERERLRRAALLALLEILARLPLVARLGRAVVGRVARVVAVALRRVARRGARRALLALLAVAFARLRLLALLAALLLRGRGLFGRRLLAVVGLLRSALLRRARVLLHELAEQLQVVARVLVLRV